MAKRKVKMLSAAQLRKIDDLSDKGSKKYYEDMPEFDDEFFRNISLEETGKTKVSIRIDDDILRWLKKHGKGYQTRANRILRSAM